MDTILCCCTDRLPPSLYTTYQLVHTHTHFLNYCLCPAEYPAERRHHRLGHRLGWLRLQSVSGGAARHAAAASLHQAASEQVPLWPRGNKHTLAQTPSAQAWFTLLRHMVFLTCCFFSPLWQLHQYQYYSTGLLATHDPFYEQQRHLLGPKKKKIKDEKKFKGKKTKKDENNYRTTGGVD